MFQVKSHCCGEIIVSGNTLEHALELAKHGSISLRNANLQHFWLLRLDLSGMDLRGANLSGSVFDKSNFESCDLTNAIVDDTRFHGCNLKHVNHTNVMFGTGALVGANTHGMFRNDRREAFAWPELTEIHTNQLGLEVRGG